MPLHLGAFALWGWAVAASRDARLTLAFSRDLPTALLDRGPYRYVRHPFYAAYTLYWVAGWVATLTWWIAAPSLVAIAFYIAAARKEEQKFAASPLADAYAAYRTRTGMFVPRLGRAGAGAQPCGAGRTEP